MEGAGVCSSGWPALGGGSGMAAAKLNWRSLKSEKAPSGG
eukprot:CAMPEP_0183800196 /NCGR_PEP_ID=MMETSP0803_2-20130417/24100_1 /TAXON_ID=195967 /ORGANISM="Crustomastix stigmata, Strain CCMP3273" /LENGTH=39 /DNA_ID= /DNA_START= /DNA_END= /DNA_ORIENTATION=